MTTPIRLKRGDSFSNEVQLVDDDGSTPIPITGWTVASQMRTRGGVLVHAFAVDMTDADEGIVILTATPAETATWPLGIILLDVEFIEPGGFKRSTENVAYEVIRDNTVPLTP